jgi:hypothetical protein
MHLTQELSQGVPHPPPAGAGGAGRLVSWVLGPKTPAGLGCLMAVAKADTGVPHCTSSTGGRAVQWAGGSRQGTDTGTNPGRGPEPSARTKPRARTKPSAWTKPQNTEASLPFTRRTMNTVYLSPNTSVSCRTANSASGASAMNGPPACLWAQPRAPDRIAAGSRKH